MIKWRDPARLSERSSKAPAVLRDALYEARAYRVSDARVRHLSACLPFLMQETATSSQAPPASGAAHGSAWMATATKVLGVALTFGVVGTAVWQAQHPASQSTSSVVSLPEISVSGNGGGQSPVVEPDRAQADEHSEPPMADPGAQPASETPLPDELAPPREQKPRPRRALKRRSARPKGGVVDELKLLRRAQQSLDHRPGHALELVREHERSYGSGVFTQEREVLAVEALLKLGNRGPAVRRGKRFIQQYPRSAHVRRIQNLLDKYPL